MNQLLVKPTRVSRLYPVFTLVLMLVSSSLVYAWQETQIRSNSAVVSRDKRIESLEEQVEIFSAQRKNDEAALRVQEQKIADAESQLSDAQSKLSVAASDLANREKQLAQAQSQLDQQKQQLSSTASQLEELRNRPPLFSFQNKSSLTDIEPKQAAIKTLVTDAYSYIQDVYDRPYLLSKVTITFVNEFSIPGSSGEIIIENGPQGISMDIHLKDFDSNDFQDVNTIIHEIVHAFHGVAVLDYSAFEEGMAVAATDAVMARMEAAGKIPDFGGAYINITESQYHSYNQTLRVVKDNDSFYSDPKISKVYQLIGKAWYGLYEENSNFFKQFNEAYYAKVQKGESPDTAAIHDIIKGIVSSVDGQPISQYLAQNRAFNPS